MESGAGVAAGGGGLLGCVDRVWTRGLDVALSPEWERRLRARRDALADAELAARAEAGLLRSRMIAEPRSAYLADIRAAVEAGESQADMARALGVSKQRMSQLVKEARGESAGE
jgi:hypothetical protein